MTGITSITENPFRVGNFTSSQVYRLMGTEKVAQTYIKEKRRERKMKRSISVEVGTRPMLWGKFLEPRVHNMLSKWYKHVFDETIRHKSILTWAGSPDFINDYEDVVSDLKCPQPNAFAELVDNLTLAMKTKNISHFKDNHADYYWQLVSNAIITGKKWIELIVYLPYEYELDEIRLSAENFDSFDQYKYRFISESPKAELAYMPDDSEYKNLNIFRFPVNQDDARLLTKRVMDSSIKMRMIV